MNGCGEGHGCSFFFKGLKGKSGTEVQRWSGMSPHSCCEFTAQGTAGGKPHFLSVCCPQDDQRVQNNLTWPVMEEGGDVPHRHSHILCALSL